MRRPLAAAALRLRLRLLSSSSTSPNRLLSPCPFLLYRRDDDDREAPSSSPAPAPAPPPAASAFSPRSLLTSASGAAGLLGLRCGWWRGPGLPPAASRPTGAVADAPPVRLTISRSYSLRVAKGKKKAHFDDEHSYGYSKERFVWSLISAVGIFCLGSGATIVHGVQNLWSSQPPENIHWAALVIGGSFLIEGVAATSLILSLIHIFVAVKAVRKGAEAEGMSIWDYIWRGHDPTSVAVMTEDGAAVTGLAIAAASLVAVQMTGNAMYDPIGSIIVGNLLGMVAIFLIQRNRHALIGRAIDDHDMQRVLEFLKSDPVVDALYDCKSEVIGPGFFRFKAEIDFNGVVLVQNYLERTGRGTWAKQFREAAMSKDDTELLRVMANYGEDVVEALGYEVDRLESEIQKLVPGIKHVDIEAHNPEGLSLRAEVL
ncbi:Metal tolerance protein C4 [Dichanthelium oligosanthes]|uniref:Metal tolerance protein C4 n=1 Tax=Dichanthelium oligosanthes TaxID=888268 RepID=A0A1E5V7L3_9POAL|nr:Metal tolerance protein C4 [Dichanthelium oligosanthes]